MAELADALDLGSSAREGVGVRVPPFAPLWNSASLCAQGAGGRALTPWAIDLSH